MWHRASISSLTTSHPYNQCRDVAKEKRAQPVFPSDSLATVMAPGCQWQLTYIRAVLRLFYLTIGDLGLRITEWHTIQLRLMRAQRWLKTTFACPPLLSSIVCSSATAKGQGQIYRLVWFEETLTRENRSFNSQHAE